MKVDNDALDINKELMSIKYAMESSHGNEELAVLVSPVILGE